MFNSNAPVKKMLYVEFSLTQGLDKFWTHSMDLMYSKGWLIIPSQWVVPNYSDLSEYEFICGNIAVKNLIHYTSESLRGTSLLTISSRQCIHVFGATYVKESYQSLESIELYLCFKLAFFMAWQT